MPLQSKDIPLGAFLKALREERIDCILIGAMAAIEQGAPLMTVDYDFWIRLPERQYVRLLSIVQRQGGTIRAHTLYELRDGTQVNAIFQPGKCSRQGVALASGHFKQARGEPRKRYCRAFDSATHLAFDKTLERSRPRIARAVKRHSRQRGPSKRTLIAVKNGARAEKDG